MKSFRQARDAVVAASSTTINGSPFAVHGRPLPIASKDALSGHCFPALTSYRLSSWRYVFVFWALPRQQYAPILLLSDACQIEQVPTPNDLSRTRPPFFFIPHTFSS